MSVSDRDRLERWSAYRDAEAFQAIVRKHSRLVYGVCVRILGNATDAEDVAQECFEILATAESLPDGHKLGPWLHGVASRRSLMRLRSQRRRQQREAAYALAHPRTSEIVWDDIYPYVDEAVSELPEELRVPLISHFFEGKSHRKIASDLGLARRTVRDRLARGIEHVKKCLARKGIVIGGVTLAAWLRANLLSVSIPTAFAAAMGRLILARTGRRAIVGATGSGASAGYVVKLLLIPLLVLMLLAISWTPRRSQPVWDRLESSPADADGVSTVQARIAPFSDHGAAGAAPPDVLVVAPDVDLSQAQLGRSAAVLDDVTGDGISDFVLGAPRANRGAGYEAAGVAMVFDGATGRPWRTIESPCPEPRCHKYDCKSSGSFPLSLAVLEDVNGNGSREIVAGAKDERVGDFVAAGHVYLLDSLTGELLRTLVTPNLQDFANLGSAVAVVPDVNGDGMDDIVAGAEQESPGGINAAGRAYIIDGATGAFLHTLESPNLPDSHTFGTTLAGLGDVDGDGYGDVVVGEGVGGAGGAHVFSGATGRLIRSLSAPSGERKDFGTHVLAIPDQDGDGIGDVMVSQQPLEGSNEFDRVHVCNPATGSVIQTLEPPQRRPSQFGAGLAYHTDFTGDGYSNFLIGAHGGRVDGDGGTVQVFSGRDGSYQGSLNPPHSAELRTFGVYQILPVPDVNGDGLDEVLITAPGLGESYLFYSPLSRQSFDGAESPATVAQRQSEEASPSASGAQETAPIVLAVAKEGSPQTNASDARHPRSRGSRLINWFARIFDGFRSGSVGQTAYAAPAADAEPTAESDSPGCRPRILEEWLD